jgi:DNA-binding IclR family transcriptional regulator
VQAALALVGEVQICISGPISRLTENVLLELKEPILTAASRLSRSLMGVRQA